MILSYVYSYLNGLSPIRYSGYTVALTAMPLDLGTNPGEDMDVCKCIVPSWTRKSSREFGGIGGEGCGSPVVKVSNHVRHVMSSIQVPLKRPAV
ncbi:hypothetical protein TNCV_3669051 [Trichonephila clavipes]|nr:hypothetical protein TNCV_3669051 [Trichonephila clavipes]